MKRYEQYKDSGVAWIGEIPAHWETVKPKYTVFLQKGTKPQELTDEDNGNLPYLTMDVLRDRANKTTMYPTSVNDLVKVDDGDILVLWDGANAGEVLLAKEGYLSSTMARFGFDTDKLDSRYWFYFLKGLEPILKEFAGGTTIPHLDSSKIMEEAYPIPSMEEQQAIVRYLDYKVAKIDKLIAENEAQVKELEKYRTAVISEVVTKGLNPNVPMRDSGIQWIGEIPAHWEVKRLKHFTRLITDGTHQTPDYIDDGIPFLSIKDVSSGSIDFSDVKYISLHQHNELSKHAPIEKGDILFTRIGTLGVFVIVDCNQAFDIFVSLGLIKLKQGLINTNFLVYYLSSHNVKEYILLVKAGEGTSAAKFNLSDVASTPVVLPPNYEQQQIVDILANKCKKIDESLRRIKTQIEELKAYKIALISEVVTGQIDVRDWKEK